MCSPLERGLLVANVVDDLSHIIVGQLDEWRWSYKERVQPGEKQHKRSTMECLKGKGTSEIKGTGVLKHFEVEF